jgi:hypothetical protein
MSEIEALKIENGGTQGGGEGTAVLLTTYPGRRRGRPYSGQRCGDL